MKIFRAVLEFNNGDINEWCGWYQKKSSWYRTRELAEMHLPMLTKFKAYLMNKCRNNDAFSCEDPKIEEVEIAEGFTPIDLEDEKGLFEAFSYIPYKGPRSISTQEISFAWYSMDHWRITVWIGEESFEIAFHWDYDKPYSIRKICQEDSMFWQYYPEDREMLLGICEDYVRPLLPLYNEFSAELEKLKDKDDSWELTRITECKYMKKLLSRSHISLTDYTVERIKEFILEHSEYPECVKAFEQLLPYRQVKEEYPVEEYSDLAIKLREALNK